MSKPINIPASAAKLHFGDLLDRCVYGGEEFVITKHGKPVVTLVGYEASRASPKTGVGAKHAHKRKSGGKKLSDPGIDFGAPIPDEDLPPLLLDIRRLRERIKKWQDKHGVKDTRTAVEWVRLAREDYDR